MLTLAEDMIDAEDDARDATLCDSGWSPVRWLVWGVAVCCVIGGLMWFA